MSEVKGNVEMLTSPDQVREAFEKMFGKQDKKDISNHIDNDDRSKIVLNKGIQLSQNKNTYGLNKDIRAHDKAMNPNIQSTGNQEYDDYQTLQRYQK